VFGSVNSRHCTTLLCGFGKRFVDTSHNLLLRTSLTSLRHSYFMSQEIAHRGFSPSRKFSQFAVLELVILDDGVDFSFRN
jgi:hypothetical protein